LRVGTSSAELNRTSEIIDYRSTGNQNNCRDVGYHEVVPGPGRIV